MSEIAILSYEPKQYSEDVQVSPERWYAIRVPVDEGKSPWLCVAVREDGVGGPAIFRSITSAQRFAQEANVSQYEVVELSREMFYSLAGRALQDGFNVFFLNPAMGGKPLKQPLSRLFDHLPADAPCLCGSGKKVTGCCLAKRPVLPWPVVHLDPVPREGAGKNEREAIPL